MAGEILDNKGRGEAGWEWPAIHPEGHSDAIAATTTKYTIATKLSRTLMMALDASKFWT